VDSSIRTAPCFFLFFEGSSSSLTGWKPALLIRLLRLTEVSTRGVAVFSVAAGRERALSEDVRDAVSGLLQELGWADTAQLEIQYPPGQKQLGLALLVYPVELLAE
jgi:hypothetical protein